MDIKTPKSPRGRLLDGVPNPIDVHVGNRIKWRRKVLKLSQQQMANSLGLTFQQIQKYEKGLNRVGASRLWDISRVLGVSMDFFFEDMNNMDFNSLKKKYVSVSFKQKIKDRLEMYGLLEAAKRIYKLIRLRK